MNKVSVYPNYKGGVIQVLQNKPLELHLDPHSDMSLYFKYQGNLNRLSKLRFLVSSNDALMEVKYGQNCTLQKISECQNAARGNSLMPVTIEKQRIEGNTYLIDL